MSETDKRVWIVSEKKDARARLQRSALELFRERGYDRTTTAEIAARAGVTERTFFRYFPDKREVLFDGQAILSAALTASIADAPQDLGPLNTLSRAFRSTVPMLEANRPYSEPRQEVIAATPALHERELAKVAALTNSLAEALKARGVAELRADLAARIGMAAYVEATLAWLRMPDSDLGERLDLTLSEIAALLA